METRTIVAGLIILALVAAFVLFGGPLLLQFSLNQKTDDIQGDAENMVQCSSVHIEVFRSDDMFAVQNTGAVDINGTITRFDGAQPIGQERISVAVGQVESVEAGSATRASFSPSSCPGLTFSSE